MFRTIIFVNNWCSFLVIFKLNQNFTLYVIQFIQAVQVNARAPMNSYHFLWFLTAASTLQNIGQYSLSPVYMIQPVVKRVVKRVRQPGVSCIQTFNRLSNPFGNRFDKRLYRVYSRLSNRVWQTAVSCIQPVVKPVVQPGLTTGLSRFDKGANLHPLLENFSFCYKLVKLS